MPAVSRSDRLARLRAEVAELEAEENQALERKRQIVGRLVLERAANDPAFKAEIDVMLATLTDKEERAACGLEASKRRGGPGRPKGSRNRPKDQVSGPATPAAATE
jgi:hypothetical protein